MVDHNCSTVITSKTKKTNGKCFEPSYLKVKALAPVFQGNSDVTSKQAVALLGKYLVETMTPAFAAKCVRAAKESSSESRETSAGKLDGYSKLLIENGWHCMVKTASAPEMKRMLIEKEKADHNLAVKNLSDAGKRKAGTFESGSVDCSEIQEGRSYMSGGPSLLMLKSTWLRKELCLPACKLTLATVTMAGCCFGHSLRMLRSTWYRYFRRSLLRMRQSHLGLLFFRNYANFTLQRRQPNSPFWPTCIPPFPPLAVPLPRMRTDVNATPI